MAFFESLHEHCVNIPRLAVEEVSFGYDKPEEDGRSVEAAEVFRAVNDSSLPQKTKNLLIDAALDPHKYVGHFGKLYALSPMNLLGVGIYGYRLLNDII